MSGPIAEMPIRKCPHCGAIYIEDDRMYEDVDRCPKCGRLVTDTAKKGEIDVE
jgi:Zn-finger nucleic acid-binding protein